MIKTIVKDVFFLGQKSTEATKEDLYLAKDLRDTLEFHKDACVGMAANMIGVKKRVIIVNIGFIINYYPRGKHKKSTTLLSTISLSLPT